MLLWLPIHSTNDMHKENDLPLLSFVPARLPPQQARDHSLYSLIKWKPPLLSLIYCSSCGFPTSPAYSYCGVGGWLDELRRSRGFIIILLVLVLSDPSVSQSFCNSGSCFRGNVSVQAGQISNRLKSSLATSSTAELKLNSLQCSGLLLCKYRQSERWMSFKIHLIMQINILPPSAELNTLHPPDMSSYLFKCIERGIFSLNLQFMLKNGELHGNKETLKCWKYFRDLLVL